MNRILTRIYFVVAFVCALALLSAGLCGPGETLAAKPAKTEKEAKNAPGTETWAKPNAVMDGTRMADMSKFDPANWVNPEGEDTIRIAVVWTHSGPASFVGDQAWLTVAWAVYDINQRGGIMVDGKKKKIALYKVDTQSKPDVAKKACERAVLQDKVHVLLGSSGSNIVKVMNEVANKYKVISVNMASSSEELQDVTNFNRYSFMTCDSTSQIGRSAAYYYGQIRKKEKKFYILCQDYSYGKDMAEGFKRGLKEYYPEAQLVGEDYHKLFLTDYAPYLTKIKASGAEVIFTGDWIPDSSNLIKQSRQMGLTIPLVGNYLDDENTLAQVGIEGSKGLVTVKHFEKAGPLPNAGTIKFYKAWNEQWKSVWKAPFNSVLFKYPWSHLGNWTQHVYWTLSVIERAKSTDPEKIIRVFEGDTFQMVNGRLIQMRACDHRAIQGFRVAEFVPPAEQKQNMSIPPYYWLDNASMPGPAWDIPAEKVLPWMDQKLDRCKGKNDWGK
ncbi:MAG: branched-chain amino acid ABC transporter substrate-binding protein [Deltaproteobacteria bacterium]|nr:branched-chain amino acid ABC transporter substrate-binding protein [Deltaproteobacteria bacterium]